MLRPLLLLALLASLAPALPATPVGAAGATYQLAPWGDDRNPGTAERPWRTLHHVAQRIGQPGFPGPGDTVLVRGGTYAGAAAFPAGGLPGAPVTFAAYPGERPVFDGSQDVSGGWEHVAGTVYRRTFVRPAALPTVVGPLEPAPVSTTPDGYQSAGDRSAFLYVDDRPDTDHWLRPYSAQVAGDGLGGAWANLPPRGFGTTAPPPPQQPGFYAGRGDTLYVNLGHLPDPDPNHHRLRIPAWEHALLLWGDAPGYLTFRGLTFQLYPTGLDAWSHADGVALDGNEFRLFKQRVVNTRRCAAGWAVTGNWFHHYSYEAIHVESDRSLVAGNLLEETLIGYAPWGPGGVNVLGSGNVVRGNVARHLRRQTAGNYSSGEATPYFVESWGLCGGESAQGNLFERNSAYGNEGQGFHVLGGDNNVFRNNLAFRNTGAGFLVEGGGTGGGLGEGNTYANGNRFLHNTAYGNTESGFNSHSKGRGTEFVNNIATGSGVRDLLIHAGATYAERNNLFGGDPRFVNAAAADFRLQAGSPAIDRGAPGLASDDFAGAGRPQGGGADIGAFEYGGAPVVSDGTFADVPGNHPYRAAIEALAARGVIMGYGDGRFGPGDGLQRAQAAAVIVRGLGWDGEDWGTPFSDRGGLDAGLWRQVGTLAHYGVAHGYGDGTFDPTGPVTQAQVISFIARAMVTSGAWRPQPDDPALFPSVPARAGHRGDLATYLHYAGAPPEVDPRGTWADWSQPATRGWLAQAFWLALESR